MPKKSCDHQHHLVVNGKKTVRTAWYDIDANTKWCERCGILGETPIPEKGFQYKEPNG